MSFTGITLITLACVFGGALLGLLLRNVLPDPHLSGESKEAVKVGIGLVATMAALVLGLLVASAKSSYDTQGTELTDMSSKIVLLDRILAHYGPDAKDARDLLRVSTALVLNRMWTTSHAEPLPTGEELYDKIQELSPKEDAQRSIQAEALSIVVGLGQMRWLMYEQSIATVSTPLVVVVIFWMTIIFISFGLFAPSNATAVTCLFVAALSVSGAIFLVLEMYRPYSGIIHISSAPLRDALAHLGQ